MNNISKKYNRVLQDYEYKRFEELRSIYEKVNKKPYLWEIINEKTHETLQDIACSSQRFESLMKYYQDKLKECRSSNIGISDEKLKIKAIEIQKKALDLMMSRNDKYWDSWKVLTIPSLANLCEMKLHRIARLWEIDAKTEDELIDTLNYMIFWLIKLYEQKK